MSKLKHHLIKAGAGTGKTYQLIQNISLLFKGFQQTEQREPRLIVCTFTKKATQELKERLLKMAEQDFKSSSIMQDQTASDSSSKNLSSFAVYSQSPSLQISTIDGILSQFLKKYGHKLDLKPDFQITEDSINSQLFDSMAEEFIYKKHFSLLEKLPYPYLKDLFLSYYQFRIQYGKIRFYEEKDFEEFNNYRQDLVYDKKNKEAMVSQVEFQEFLNQNPQSLLQDIPYESLKKLMLEPEIFLAKDFLTIFKEFQKVAQEFFPLFIQKKKNSQLLEIQDLLLFSLHLLNQNPEVAKSFGQEWDYWFIDEYQDTSFLQEQVIEKITQFKKVFCVGDPAQSIYSFRHADPEVFKKREREILKKGESLKTLTVNRRSSPSLIAFYNDFFLSFLPNSQLNSQLNSQKDSQNKNPKQNSQYDKFYNPYMKLQAHPDYSDDPKQACVSFFTYQSQQQPALLKTLCSYIQQLSDKGIPYKDIAILSSNNKDLAQIAHYLRKQQTPILLYSSKKFSDQRILLDSLFLLKFLINPYDDVNLKALLRTPYFKLPDQELALASYKHYSQENKTAFWLFLNEQNKHKDLLIKLNFYLKQSQQLGLVEAFQKSLFDCGIMDLSYWQDPTFSVTANLWKLLDLLKNKGLSGLQIFYKLMDKDQDSHNLREVPSGEDLSSVLMMTIHASKGLEFEHVIIVDSSLANSDLRRGDQSKNNIIYDTNKQKMAFACPVGGRNESKVKSFGQALYNKSQDFQKSLERDRLFYVAMTRAKKSLSLFIPTLKKPEKNSWLERTIASFFKEQKDFYGIKNIGSSKKPEFLWDLKPGVFNKKGYSVQIFKSEEYSEKPTTATNIPIKTASSNIPIKTDPPTPHPSSNEPISASNTSSLQTSHKKTKTQTDLIPKAKDRSLKNNTSPKHPLIKSQSSKDFIQYALNITPKELLQTPNNKNNHKTKTSNVTPQETSNITQQELLQTPDNKNNHKTKTSNITQQELSQIPNNKNDHKTKISNITQQELSNITQQETSKTPNKNDHKDKTSNVTLKESLQTNFSFHKTKNQLAKVHLGKDLHFFLQKLFYFSESELQTLLNYRDKKTQQKLKQAIDYIQNLKTPNFAELFKKGFVEWPFQFKRENVILQGQIDLWSRSPSTIYVIDYKSSMGDKNSILRTQKQLIFYSWILNQQYPSDPITMIACYPFEQKIQQIQYQKKHKQECENWFQSL